MSNLIKISEAASIAFHAAAYMASHPERLVATHELAETMRFSEAHVAKVLQRLVKAGLVDSTRGPHGGFKLAKKGNRITLLDIYQAIEGPLTTSECLIGVPVCGGDKCIFGDMLHKLNAQIKKYLEETRITDYCDFNKEETSYA